MSFDLSGVSTVEIYARIEKAKCVHPMEACRVGMYLGALEEIARLREAVATRTEERDRARRYYAESVEYPSINAD